MFRVALVACLLALAVSSDDWAWGSSSKDKTTKAAAVPSAQDSEAQITQAIFATTVLNGTEAERVVDTILSSKREGRTLGEDAYQQVAQEPALQRALAQGDNVQARSIVKERLCNLGLMACDDEVEGKGYGHGHGGHVQPQDVFYAQPVAIKPVGQPIPAVPVRNPHAYRPPPPGFNGGPPGGAFNGGFNGGPSFNGPVPPPGYGGAFPRPGYGPAKRPPPIGSSGIYGPPKPVPTFELGGGYGHKQGGHLEKEVIGGGAVTHVHHHYHHGGPGGADGGIPPPINSGGFYPGFGKENPGFSKVPPPPVYEQESDLEVEDPGYGGQYGASNYGNQFYKKELSLNKKTQLQSGNSLSSSYAGQYQGYESQRADNCYCVPAGQCPASEVIGRKDGGSSAYLIDPRHQGSDIEAESGTESPESSEPVKRENAPETNATTSEVAGNTTETTRTKRQATSSAAASSSSSNAAQAVSGTRVGRNGKDSPELGAEMAGLLAEHEPADLHDERSLRDTNSSIARDFDEQAEPSEPQLRLFGLGGDRSKVKPTFGVSFGLPYGYGQPYPLNPFGSVPSAINPFFGSVGPGGLSLGPVSVNPLLSIQVTKDDFGEKIIKPLVNLHVTPNAGLIHKFKGFVGGIAGGHGGHYPPPPPPYYEKPFHHHPPPPPYYEKPFHGPPPSFHGPPHFGGGPFRGNQGNQYDDSEEYDEDDEYDYPSGRGIETLTNNTNSFRPTSNNYRSQYAPTYPTYQNQRSDTPTNQGSSRTVKFPRNKRATSDYEVVSERQFGGNYIGSGSGRCSANQVCCRRPGRPNYPVPNQGQQNPQCGRRNAQGINGRIKNPVYVDGDSEFGEYPWQAAILKKDAHESVYVCGGTLIDSQHIITAAHCVKGYNGQELRVRLGEWDVNHDVEFYPYIETDVVRVHIHPEFYAGTLINDLAVLKLARPVDLQRSPHISPACMPDPQFDYNGARCYTTGWGKDAFGDFGKYQNILKEVDVPVVSHHQCQSQLQQTRLGYDFKLHPGFVCAGGEEGKDACKGDGGGPMVCERFGSWQVVGVVSWGIGCGQYGVPGVYVRVAHYLDWIRQVTRQF